MRRALLCGSRGLVSLALAATPALAQGNTPARPHIVLVGDSTVTDGSGWGLGFRRFVSDAAQVTNLAQGGRSSKSYLDEGHWARALQARGDYYLIQFGHNDQPGKGPERETDPATTYTGHLSRFVDEVRAQGGQPILVTSLVRRNFSSTDPGRLTDTLKPYAQAVITLGSAKGVPVIDLHSSSLAFVERLGPAKVAALNPGRPDGTPDTTHLDASGSEVFARLVVEELRRKVKALVPVLLEAPRTVTASAPSANPVADAAPVTGSIPVAWGSGVLTQRPDWYGTKQARDMAESVIQYQSPEGAWPKGTNLAVVPRTQADLPEEGERNTIDNNATTLPMQFLARVVMVTDEGRYRDSFIRGLDYLFKAQYPGGGWPQFFPLRKGYYSHITFNDNAMVNVLTLLRDVAAGKAPFAFVDEPRRVRARDAVARGIETILRTQLKQGGKLTAWCAQYDEKTLQPAWARAYEPPSLSGNESVGIVRFLIGLDAPSPEIVASVEGAVSWLKSVAVRGSRLEDFTLPDGRKDRRVVADPDAPPMWARFYELETNRPIFLGRDSVVHYSLSEIEHERRNGYAYYGPWAENLLSRDYPRWRERLDKR